MLHIYNSYTRKKEEFVPLVEGKVSMYVCGITPYNNAHIGNARPSIIFDTLHRFLEFQGFDVTHARNFTDVDDKIIARAKEETGADATKEACYAVAERYIDIYHRNMKALNVRSHADTETLVEPRVTEYMPQIIQMVATLLDKGIAYVGKSGDVLYDTTKFPEYGRLSGKKLDELIAGARVEVSDDKKNPTDFVLWKSAKAGEPSWDFDEKYPNVNAGRPGWHIECSAMSGDIFGHSFDIHCGGEDLQFPHHDCEIAQSKGANGGEFARYWMHNAFITVDGEKMAKSGGNFVTISDVLNQYNGESARLWMLGTHYRKPVDYSDRVMQDAEKSIKKIYKTLAEYNESPYAFMKEEPRLPSDFVACMEDDLNTAGALAVFREVANLLSKAMQAADAPKVMALHAQLMGMGKVLGLLQTPVEEILHVAEISAADKAEIESLIAARNTAKLEKNWAKADEIRDQLVAMGIQIMDSKEGTTWEKIS